MRPPLFTSAALTGAVRAYFREAALANRRARLKRELSRLPNYVAEDIDLHGLIDR